MRSQVQLQKDNYDDVIIECGGRDSTAMRAALTITDVLIVPSAPGSFEAWAMDANVALIQEARSIRDNLVCFSVLNKGDTHARSTDNLEMIEMMKDYQDDIPVLDTVIYQRKAFANAAGSGRTVEELKSKGRDRVAIAELNNLMLKLFKD